MQIGINNNTYFGINYNKRISKKDLERLLYDGRTYQEISEIYNISINSIQRLIKGYKLKSSKEILKETRNSAIIYMFNSGIPFDLIEQKLKITEQYINMVIKDFIKKNKTNPRESYSDPLVASIIKKLHINKKSIEDSLI